MNLTYKKADIECIEDLVELKMKQTLFNYNIDGNVIKNEDIARESIKKILLQELNKTIYFFVAINEMNKVVACNGVVIHQMVPSDGFLNGKKAYITSVYTEEQYRRKGIQNKLMQICLSFLKEIECSKIELDASNPDAIKLYEKFGFIKDSTKYILKS